MKEKVFSQNKTLDRNIIGDQVVMAMLKGINAQDAKKNSTNLFDKNKSIIDNKLKDLIICSNESNADYTARNSDAFVCWINSKDNELTKESYNSLSKIAQNIYIMFDIDDAGKRGAEKNALKYLNIRIIYLPDKLKKIKSPETQEFCKSAKEYFSLYDPKLMEDFDEGIRTHFERLMNSSLSLQFWRIKKNNKYEINSVRVYRFLSAKGLYRNTCKKKEPYIYIKEKTKEYFSNQNAIIEARQIMKSYIRKRTEFTEELERIICDATLKLQNLPVFDIDEEFSINNDINQTEPTNSKLLSIIGEESIKFFNIFFAKEYNYNCPIDRQTLFLNYKDYKDDSKINDMSIKEQKSFFRSQLNSYCNLSGIEINPPIVLKTNSDKERKEVRTKAWCIKEENGTPNKYYRKLTSSKGALYFYKQGEEPSNIRQIGKAPEIDPELG